MGEDVKTIGSGSRKREGSNRLSAQQQQKADALMSSRKFKSAITRAHNQTDNNYHGEARRTISKAFGYNDLADSYQKVINAHDEAGYLTKELLDRRNELDNELEKRIKKNFGENGIRAYNRGLS